MMTPLNEYFSDKQVESILDVGTGPGHFIPVLLNVFPDATITGIDPDRDALQIAARQFPKFSFREMKGETIDFADNTFDIASISMALHHLSDIDKTLHEMQRVVKPGGCLIVNELFSDNLNPAQNVHKRMHHFRSKIDRLNGICHNESFTRKEILQHVRRSVPDIVLSFEHKSSTTPLNTEEAEQQKAKLLSFLQQAKGMPTYNELAEEVRAIETALEQHGFEMATRLVVVAQVHEK